MSGLSGSCSLPIDRCVCHHAWNAPECLHCHYPCGLHVQCVLYHWELPKVLALHQASSDPTPGGSREVLHTNMLARKSCLLIWSPLTLCEMGDHCCISKMNILIPYQTSLTPPQNGAGHPLQPVMLQIQGPQLAFGVLGGYGLQRLAVVQWLLPKCFLSYQATPFQFLWLDKTAFI